MSEHAIALAGVRKTFGRTVAVEGLDLVVPRGSLCGFIGPNGAGKTTTLRMIMSILFPDAGEVRVLGRRSAVESKDRIGYLPEERGLYRKMRVGAFLGYVARIKGVAPREVSRRVRGWLERVGLVEVEAKRCEELSKGMQQKVQFIAAVVHDPDLLILDEPFSGLDPVNMRLLRDLVRELHDSGKTVVFSTHVMHQAEQLCDRIFMIHRGRKVLDATMADIRARFDPRTILVEPIGADPSLHALRGLPGVRRISAGDDGCLQVDLAEGADPRAAIRGIVETAPVSRVELHRPTLEDVFVQIVQGGAGRDEQALRSALRDEAARPLPGGTA